MIYSNILKLKTKWFNKWSEKNIITDAKLLKVIDAISNNLGIVDLGGNLYKVRISRTGQGKSGGFRTLVVFKESDRAIFLYGFSKNEKDNLDKEELKYFKKLGKDLLGIDKKEYLKMEQLGLFISLKE